MTVFACFPLDARQLARLREAAAPDEVVLDPAPGPGARAVFDRCEIAFGNPPPEWVATSPSLRWIQLESVGFGEYADLDWSRLAERVSVTNLAGFFAEPVAESALAGILALLRGVDQLVELKTRREWLGDPLRARLRTLACANVVLFGYGAINRRLEELLAPFGCRVVAFASGWTPAALDAALAEADLVVCTAPDTPSSRRAFDGERLGRLGCHTLFVNLGRGSLVDEAALAEALTSGRLGGAVIDVTLDEPLPDGHPLWFCPNILLTQHTGGGTVDEVDRKVEVFAENLARFRRGEPLHSMVDFARGY